MSFFSRPDLSSFQFKQLHGSELTLSGQTRIATTSGLTLTDGAGGYIPIIATGATNNYVLTYDSADDAIKLKESSASGGSTVYTYSGNTTCAVGGLPIGQNLFNDPLVDIIHCMVSPTVYPALTNPSISSFTLSPSTTIYEVGTVSNISGVTSFSPGAINPQYTAACSCRSNGTISYDYNFVGIPTGCVTNSPSNIFPFGAYPIGAGNNIISATVCYLGGVQPYDSSGVAYCSPLSTGVTATCQKTVSGIYPWYWGTSTIAPNISTSGCTQCLINTYTCKYVASSTGSIFVNNFNVIGKYIWFATPYASTTKTRWQGSNNVSNNGIIPGGLFPAPTSWCVDSCSTCWSDICYKVYVSNYATDINYGMTFCN